jgi:hypothetical protein
MLYQSPKSVNCTAPLRISRRRPEGGYQAGCRCPVNKWCAADGSPSAWQEKLLREKGWPESSEPRPGDYSRRPPKLYTILAIVRKLFWCTIARFELKNEVRM